MDFFRFLFSKRFLKHLGWVVACSAVLVLAITLWLNWYTGHKRYIVVPDFKGKMITEVRQDVRYDDFEFVLLDSLYEHGVAPGTIIGQEPAMGSNVKHHRKIYLTVVSSLPEMIAMPDLKFLTLRQATSMLESYGLKLGTISYTRSFDQNAVQAQYFEGKTVKPGVKLYKGSIIDLVVGMSSGSKEEPEVEQNTEETPDTLADDF